MLHKSTFCITFAEQFTKNVDCFSIDSFNT